MEEALQQAITACLNEDFFDAFPFFDEHLEEEQFKGKLRKLFNQAITKVCCRELALLIAEDGNYRFLHQNFRDYFAARHVQNQIQIALQQKVLPDVLKNAPLDFYIRHILGELEGEHYNKPVYLEKERRWSADHCTRNNLLARSLEQCRGVFDAGQLGYTVWNTLTIGKEQRGELSGASLGRLNFQEFSFNGLRSSWPGLAARLREGVFRAESLFSQGHWAGVNSVAYSPDGGRILTGSLDKTAKVWDAQTGQCLLTLEGHWASVSSVAYSPDGGRILTGSSDKTAKVCDAQTGACLMTLPNIPGLLIQGCDFRNLHPASELSEGELLR